MAILSESSLLAGSLARVCARDPAAPTAEIGPLEAGWFRADDLWREATPYLADALARLAAQYAGSDGRTCGAFFIGKYVWYLCAAAVEIYLAERRAPDLAPHNIALRYDTHSWEEDGESGETTRISVRFLSGRCAVLADDAAAGHAEAIVVSDAAALREWLRVSLESHLTPLIERIALMTRLGARAQWVLAADACAALFLRAGDMLGDTARAQAQGMAFIKAPDSPMRNPGTAYITLEYAGQSETFCARGGCCRYYTLPAGAKCTMCVLRPPAERDERLRAYLAQKYASLSVSRTDM